MNTAKRLDALITHLKTSYNNLSQELGITQTRLYHIAKGRNKISSNLANLIVEKYPEISYEWLVSGEGNMLAISNKKQEYEVITFDSFEAGHQQRFLNERSQQGWELVSAVHFTDTDGTPCFRFYFKRKV